MYSHQSNVCDLKQLKFYQVNVIFVLTAFNLDYYTEVLDLKYLLEHLSDDPFLKKYKKLNEALIGVIEDYSLVSFVPLNIQVCDPVT